MRPRFEKLELTAPSAWASYLINGDASGLNDGEERDIDQWLDHCAPAWGVPVDVSEESEFRKYHSASMWVGGADCVTYLFMRPIARENDNAEV